MVDVHTVFSSYDGFEYCVFQNRDFVEIYVCVKILLKAMAPWVPLSFSRNKLRLDDPALQKGDQRLNAQKIRRKSMTVLKMI